MPCLCYPCKSSPASADATDLDSCLLPDIASFASRKRCQHWPAVSLASLSVCVWVCRYAFGITLWEIFTAARPYQVRFWSYRMLPLQKSKHSTMWFYSGQPCQPAACELIACRISSLHAGRYASTAGAPCLTTARTSSLPSRHATGLCLVG